MAVNIHTYDGPIGLMMVIVTAVEIVGLLSRVQETKELGRKRK